jgi:hypothetical protein
MRNIGIFIKSPIFHGKKLPSRMKKLHMSLLKRLEQVKQCLETNESKF